MIVAEITKHSYLHLRLNVNWLHYSEIGPILILSQYCLGIPFIMMFRIPLILSLLHETCVSVPQETVDIFSEISGSTLETAIAIFSQSVYVHMT